MNNSLAESNSIREYFDGTAKAVQAIASVRHRYYWQEIFEQCDYFSHETFRVLELGFGWWRAGGQNSRQFKRRVLK
jgi:hypothetical protein